jgi:hypothetical protein
VYANAKIESVRAVRAARPPRAHNKKMPPKDDVAKDLNVVTEFLTKSGFEPLLVKATAVITKKEQSSSRYLALTKFRILVLKIGKRLIRAARPSIVVDLHLFDVVKLVSKARNLISVVCRSGKEKQQTEQHDFETLSSNDSFDDFITLVCAIDETLFPSKAREDLINIDVPLSRMPYVPGSRAPLVCLSSLRTLQNLLMKLRVERS